MLFSPARDWLETGRDAAFAYFWIAFAYIQHALGRILHIAPIYIKLLRAAFKFYITRRDCQPLWTITNPTYDQIPDQYFLDRTGQDKLTSKPDLTCEGSFCNSCDVFNLVIHFSFWNSIKCTLLVIDRRRHMRKSLLIFRWVCPIDMIRENQ